MLSIIILCMHVSRECDVAIKPHPFDQLISLGIYITPLQVGLQEEDEFQGRLREYFKRHCNIE